jgi:hypothetical protein
MANRVTDSDVLTILADVDKKSYKSLLPFISVAHSLVEDVCVTGYAAKGLPAYTEEKLKNIELWLSAHFYCTADPRAVTESAGAVSQQLSIKTALMLANSMYGQTAMVMDYPNGGLAQASSNAEDGKSPLSGIGKVGIAYVGNRKRVSCL